MDFLLEWTRQIVMIVVLFTILELIVKEGKTKKNVIFVLGIIASITIATPIITLLKKDFELKDVFDSFDYDVLIYTDRYSDTVSAQISSLEKVFANEIVRKFKEKYPDIELVNCLVIFNKDSDGRIVDIERINVTLHEENEDALNKIANIAEVPREKVTMDILSKE